MTAGIYAEAIIWQVKLVDGASEIDEGLAGDRTRIPGGAAEAIERPNFVVGMARTGTSLFH